MRNGERERESEREREREREGKKERERDWLGGWWVLVQSSSHIGHAVGQ